MEEHWSYDLLKDIVNNDKNIQDNLGDLKALYRDVIDSPRNMSRIKTTDDLLDYLERQDFLSETKIEPLREIADQFPDSNFEEAVSTYICPKKPMVENDICNEYREMRLAEELRNNLRLNDQNNCGSDDRRACCACGDQQCQQSSRQVPVPSPAPPAPTPSPYAGVLTDKKRAAIYKYIAENIGKFWRTFGRELNMKQGKMDELEMVYPRDLVSRVHKMLQIFEEDECNDPKRFVLTLCRALDESRRKDMRRKVEEIMSH